MQPWPLKSIIDNLNDNKRKKDIIYLKKLITKEIAMQKTGYKKVIFNLK